MIPIRLQRISKSKILKTIQQESFFAVVPMIRIVVDSMNYDVSIFAVITGTDVVFKTNPETNHSAIKANLKTASIYTNCGSDTKG